MIEMMVTIGVLVLVAVGVSTIFTSIGDTVDRGRKISELNRFASQIERVMREDFEHMTRDGFLVIANQYATDQTGTTLNVQVSNADPTPRPRRVDQIMFFARDQFTSARRPLVSGMTASSSEAAIWYGHGQKRPAALGTGNIDTPVSDVYLFFNPATYDHNIPSSMDASLGLNALGGGNPNRFAKDWSLLRHVTLLVSPQNAGRVLPQNVYGLDRRNPAQRPFLEDSERQIALQPVARSIFGGLRGTDLSRFAVDPNPPLALSDPFINSPADQSVPRRRASGVVDLAVGDLAMVRSIVTSLSSRVHGGSGLGADPRLLFGDGVRTYDNFARQYFDPTNTTVDPSVVSTNRRRIREWMINALPGEWDLAGGSPIELSRVRYEDVPTRIVYDEGQFANTDAGRLEQAIAESNQEMLGSSVFLPRCTEFIVEWSFGYINENITVAGDPDFKQMIWYGLDRQVDSNSNGVIDTGDKFTAAVYNRSFGRVTSPIGPEELLIVGHPAGVLPAGNAPEVACFGYFDPKGTADVSNDEIWIWPKFIRVTMSIADPTDPTIEETYQVVFEVPAGTS